MKNKVNILGVEYSLEQHKRKEDVKLTDANGYAELFTKRLIIEDVEDDPRNVENLPAYINKVARHEIVHAFFFESGLMNNSEYAYNEELVDWIALQGEKLYNAWKEAGVL